jgi:hypothetical protein
MTMPPPPTIPEVGQLVDVRQRRFIVTDVMASSLPRDPLALRHPNFAPITDTLPG